MQVNKDENTISQYLSDESNGFLGEGVDRVYFPETEKELAEILSSTREKVTTSGAGTGITGSRVPVHGGIVISTERMIRCRAREGFETIERKGLAGDIGICLDREKEEAIVSPGISLAELDAALPPGWVYPPDPTETSATIGGNVATNASGARCFYFGPTRNWVKGLRVVLHDGEILNIRRGHWTATDGVLKFNSESGKDFCVAIPNYHMPEIKNAAGLYSKPGMDLIDLFIGSEGMLGIISEITLGLWKTEGSPVSDLAFFEKESDALGYVERLRKLREKGVLAVEFFDRNSLDFVREEHPELKDDLDAGVFVELMPGSMDLMEELNSMLAEFHAIEDWCATTFANRRDLKEFRHSLPDGINSYLKQHNSYKMGTDFVVPEENFRDMMQKYREVGERFRAKFPGARYVIFGHIGDCHVHFNFITSNEDEREGAKVLYLELARYAIKLGGTISGEHGVGKKTMTMDGRNIPYLELMLGKDGLREIARVKKALDPELRLNLGNMVPVQYLDS